MCDLVPLIRHFEEQECPIAPDNLALASTGFT
jgi:hypothetical protein